MTAPLIRFFGARCLRRRCRDAEVLGPATRELLDSMWALLSEDGGVGLAAPQVGVEQRVVVVRDPGRPVGEQRLDLVNPRVERTFGPHEQFEEGCLSFPGLYARVLRPKGIELTYLTPDCGEERQSLRDEALLARIIQHEVDHLDGVLLIDHLSVAARGLLGPRLLWIMARHLLIGSARADDKDS